MELPNDINLPFFAYGNFKPGELGYFRISDYTDHLQECSITGTILIRDGLPIIDPEGSDRVIGVLIYFKEGANQKAYRSIIDIEPESQYKWNVVNIEGDNSNYLAGRSPHEGSLPLEDHGWTGRSDPLFTVALELVKETLNQNRDFKSDLKPLLRLEMAYLLLWSSIERYASLRYSFGSDAKTKINNIGEEEAFKSGLSKNVKRTDKIFGADRPNRYYHLDASNPAKSLDYYYKIRCNIIHRGKAAIGDHDRLVAALEEMLVIFRLILKSAFND